MRLSALLRLLFLLPLALALTACDSDKDDNGLGFLTGQSSVRVTDAGPANSSFTGGSHFTYLKEMNLFSLVAYRGSLADQSDGSQMVTFHSETGLPSKGKHNIGEDGPITAIYVLTQQGDESSIVIAGTSGTLTITSVSGSRMEGSFTFSGGMAGVANQAGGTVTGTFKASSMGSDKF